jgi:hypothetical protein
MAESIERRARSLRLRFKLIELIDLIELVKLIELLRGTYCLIFTTYFIPRLLIKAEAKAKAKGKKF